MKISESNQNVQKVAQMITDAGVKIAEDDEFYSFRHSRAEIDNGAISWQITLQNNAQIYCWYPLSTIVRKKTLHIEKAGHDDYHDFEVSP